MLPSSHPRPQYGKDITTVIRKQTRLLKPNYCWRPLDDLGMDTWCSCPLAPCDIMREGGTFDWPQAAASGRASRGEK